MQSQQKAEIHERIDRLQDSHANEILQFLKFLEFKTRNEKADFSSMLLSEKTLAKDWLTPEEDKAWQHL